MGSRKIFLVGLPASGKTTMARKLAHELGIKAFDMDEAIEEKAGRSIPEIFENDGEEEFRKLEQERLSYIIGLTGDLVVSTGGGAPCYFDNLDRMKQNGVVVHLNTPLNVIAERLAQADHRPLMKLKSLEDLIDARMPFYKQAHHSVVNYDQLASLFA